MAYRGKTESNLEDIGCLEGGTAATKWFDYGFLLVRVFAFWFEFLCFGSTNGSTTVFFMVRVN